MVLHGKDDDGESRPIKVSPDGTVATSATVEPAPGGATEAKQDDAIALLAGGLPAALTAGGGVKVGLVDALPTGTNTIGAVTGPAAAALATQATLDALNNKVPAAQALGGTLSTPTAPILGAMMCGYSSALTRPIALPVDSTGIPSVIARRYPPTSRSASVSLQTGRVVAAFSVTPYVIRVWSALAGYVVALNKASAAADGDIPYGARVWQVEAGDTIEHEFESRLSFTTGLVIAHFTQIWDGVNALVTVAGATPCLLVEALYD